MSQTSLSAEWLRQFTDPYAVLGLSVTADDRRVLKRYRVVAKVLHPDSFTIEHSAEKELAGQLFARIVNPAYQKIKQEPGRAEIMAMLRFRVRRMSREEPLVPTAPAALRLMEAGQADLDVLYEQAITELADQQYAQLSHFESFTQQLAEVNLVYLRLKMGDPLIREKRTGLVSADEAKPIQFTPLPPDASPSTTSYAQRHYQRAEEYVKKANWSMAVQELRDAIKIEPDKSAYHSLLAKAYFMQNLPGMAKVHFRQALKLNPKDPLAVEYAPKFKLDVEQPPNGKTPNSNGKPNTPNTPNSGGLFGRFAKKR
ncbi:MAG TPA: DnaJ domain-containing protein [Chroococcidiopsis sp.]